MKLVSKKSLASILGIIFVSIHSFTAFSDSLGPTVPYYANVSIPANLTPSAAVGDTGVSAYISANNPSATYYLTATPTAHQNELLYQYFKNSVIIGDSIGSGWGIRCLKYQSDPVMGNFQSLAYAGFCVHSAFDPTIKDAGTPLYMGQRRPVWESLQLMSQTHPGETTHIYLHFGYKDMPWDDTPEQYVKLIQTLQTYVPDSDVTILGASYIYPGNSCDPYSSSRIKALNASMQQYAANYGWGYINIGEMLSDQNGNLKPEYCSDEIIHLTPAGYDVWYQGLTAYALARMSAAGIQ